MSSRPEYGEYATPEEQALARGLEAPVVEAPPPAESASPPRARSLAAPVGQATGEPGAPRPRTWDRILTFLLLGMATWTTITSVSQFANLAIFIGDVYALWGYDGSHPDPAFANGIGLAINIVQPVILILTFWIAVGRLRRGRLTFWVPLAAGALNYLVLTVLIGLVIAADPDLMAYLASGAGV